MAKLSDLQALLLSTAAQRTAGQLLPPAESVTATPDRVAQAIASLLKRSLVDEVPVTALDHAWRVDDDLHFGAVINYAGRRAIGIEPEDTRGADTGSAVQPEASTSAAPRGPTKAALLLSLLQREQGATLAELVEATGWLPHTVRAALTGVRKKRYAVAKGKRGEETCYTVAA